MLGDAPVKGSLFHREPLAIALNELALKWHCVYNDQPWDPEFVAIVDRRSLFRGSLM